jgi:AraC-like DNA-binding protein
MLKVPMVDAVWAKQLHDLLAEAGRPTARILRQAGIEPARIETPGGRIPFVRHAELLEAAAAEFADDLLGLRFGITRNLRDAGLIAYVTLNSATYADAVRNLERYFRVFSEGYQLRGLVDGNTVVLSGMPLDACVYHSRQAQDFAVAAHLAASRSLTHRNLTPDWVEVYHAPPRDPAAAERLLGAPIHYTCARLAIIAPRSWLDLPISHADNRLLCILEGYCREILAQYEESDDFPGRLERWLMRRLPSGRFVAAEAARDLGMSPRTLSRRLRECGTSFAALTNDLRRRLAFRYLDHRDLKPSQIAYLLGYSEPSAFNHAFRLWTGRSPNAHRGANGSEWCKASS